MDTVAIDTFTFQACPVDVYVQTDWMGEQVGEQGFFPFTQEEKNFDRTVQIDLIAYLFYCMTKVPEVSCMQEERLFLIRNHLQRKQCVLFPHERHSRTLNRNSLVSCCL